MGDDRAAQIHAFYARHGERFDRERGRGLMERPYLERMRARLPAHAAILDVGCGGGEPIAAWCLAQGYDVTGIDREPSLLALCRTRFPGATWLELDMRALDLATRFDAVIAWDSLFHLDHEDQRRTLPRLAAHLRPGGALLFTTGPAHGIAENPLFGTQLFHASLAAEEYEAILAAHGLVVLEHVVEDPDCGGHTVWLALRRGGDP